jgi:hypothetical protein
MTGVLSLEGRQPGHEGDHSLAFSAEVTNEWSYTSTLSYAFMACTRKTGYEHNACTMQHDYVVFNIVMMLILI